MSPCSHDFFMTSLQFITMVVDLQYYIYEVEMDNGFTIHIIILSITLNGILQTVMLLNLCLNNHTRGERS